MHIISHPCQVCLVSPGWYERCVALVQQASHWGLLQPLCSAHVWLWFRERDMIDSPDGAIQLFSYSVQCGSRSPCRCCRPWACIHSRTDTKYKMSKIHRCMRAFSYMDIQYVHMLWCRDTRRLQTQINWLIHSCKYINLLAEKWTTS